MTDQQTMTQPKKNRADGVPRLRPDRQDDALTGVQQYLVRFGYLAAADLHPGASDETTSTALAGFQHRLGLDETGQADGETRGAMAELRCGVPDLIGDADFATLGVWNRTNLTFAFEDGTDTVAGAAEFDAIRRAFATWSAASSLTFTEVGNAGNPDIRVDWRPEDCPDCAGDLFGNTIAHADFPPGNGVFNDDLPRPVHFDNTVTWADGAVAGALDVETVALHEIGHIIGMLHTDVRGSVMWPSISAGTLLRTLQPDDLAGVRSLYPPLPTGPRATGDDMQPGEVLRPGDRIRSANGRYDFVYQGDGNLVLYDRGRALWASNTHGRPAGVCIMQHDGNLVVYGPDGRPQWSSDTWRRDDGSHLRMQDDGNAVIYQPDGRPVWATGTWIGTGPSAAGDDMNPGELLHHGQQISSRNGRYQLVYQADGNLVLYDRGRALWASGTDGKTDGWCVFQPDGNLVVYTRNGVVRWAANSHGKGGTRLVVQDDGNVVIYRADGRPVWATGTWAGLGPIATGDDMQPGELLQHDNRIFSANRQYEFVYQNDGNLVLYGRGRALWASGTHGKTDGWCVFQPDGNLVVYTRNGVVRWAANSHGKGGTRLVVQDDGNVVIYRADGRPVWDTGTWR